MPFLSRFQAVAFYSPFFLAVVFCVVSCSPQDDGEANVAGNVDAATAQRFLAELTNGEAAFESLRAEGEGIAVGLLAAGDREGALRILSQLGLASGAPVDYLYGLIERLPVDSQDALWPDTPYLVIEDFERETPPLVSHHAFQNRDDLQASIDTAGGYQSARSLVIRASEARGEGRTTFGVDLAYFRVSDRPFGLRAYAKTTGAAAPYLYLGYTLEGGERLLEAVHQPASTRADGWVEFDTGLTNFDVKRRIVREFYVEHFFLPAARPENLRLKDVAASLQYVALDLPHGGESTYWLDEIQVYVPPKDTQAALGDLGETFVRTADEEGFAFPVGGAHDAAGLTEAQRESIAQLNAIGYLGAENEAPNDSGVVVHHPERAYAGWNFYTSGHGPTAYLIDMDGTVMHRWALQPGGEGIPDDLPPAVFDGHFRRAHLYPNGDVLAVIESTALLKIDKESRVVWARAGNYHHDIHVQDDGSIFVLTRKAHIVPRIHETEPILEDFVTHLTANGDEIRSVSVMESLEQSRYASLLEKTAPHGDILHTNSLEVLDGRHAGTLPAFRRGNVLVSFPKVDAIGVIDLDAESVVWASEGGWRFQHDPTLLDDGSMMVFDNLGPSLVYGYQKASRVVQFDPVSGEVRWEFGGNRDRAFFSRTCGAATYLPNGNVLISETDAGAAWEVTPDREVVWKYVNPLRAGPNDELIAKIMELKRYSADFPTAWADPPPGQSAPLP